MFEQIFNYIWHEPKAPVGVWQHVTLAPPDSVFRLTVAYNADPSSHKVNLGTGTYRDDKNEPWVLPCVKKATQILLSDPGLNNEYLPITGLPEYTASAVRLLLGAKFPAIQEGRVVSVQTISGTGANHLGALFMSKFYGWNTGKRIWVGDPTWPNTDALLGNVGIEPVSYAYYSPASFRVDFEGMLRTLLSAPRRSVFLFHACAHNPTGVDPTRQQWTQIAEVMLGRDHFAFFDCAYQGFATGDLDEDAWALRYFASREVPMLICQSFSKNAGMYGQRVGALHVITPDKAVAQRVTSQLAVLQRSEITSPPSHGARLVALILNDPKLFAEWKQDIKTMSSRLVDMRKELHRLLTKELKTPGNWDHIINQVGMFSFLGIDSQKCQTLGEKAHVYMMPTGRISMAGLNSHNIHYFAENLDRVVRGKM